MLACWKSEISQRTTFPSIVNKLREMKVSEVYQMGDYVNSSLNRCGSTQL